MFVGHYAAAFALKGKIPNASLGLLFLAVQFVDILFFPFVLLGIESLEIVPNFTEANSFKMEHYPYSHGLLSSVVLSILIYVFWYFVIERRRLGGKSIALVLALGVLSHWFFDLIVHTPDLPLIYGEPKFGLGLWNSDVLTFSTESILLIFGSIYFIKKTTPINNAGKYVVLVFTLFLILVGYLNLFVIPEQDTIISLTTSALIIYFLMAYLAYFVEKQRV